MQDDHLASKDAVPLDSLGLDAFEQGILAVLRHFLVSYSQPQSQAWETAFQIAAERWGASEGPRLAMRIMAVLQALRRTRSAAFEFANPLCLTCRDQATGDEAQLMRLIRVLRCDRADLGRAAVESLTGGRRDPVLISAALELCQRHPLPAHKAPDRGHLRLVR